MVAHWIQLFNGFESTLFYSRKFFAGGCNACVCRDDGKKCYEVISSDIDVASFFQSNYDFISEMLLRFRKKASFHKVFKAIEIDNVEIEERYIQMQELQLFITGISLYFLNNKNKNNAAI